MVLSAIESRGTLMKERGNMSSINGERMQPLTPEILKGRLMLRVREYAELTGTPIPSVYRYLALGKLPGIRIGNTLRISVSALTNQLKG
jgi:excisionase family DNA binding protein